MLKYIIYRNKFILNNFRVGAILGGENKRDQWK